VADANAILVYLARKLGRTDWLPADPQGEAAVQRWLGPLVRPRLQVDLNRLVRDAEQREEQPRPVGVARESYEAPEPPIVPLPATMKCRARAFSPNLDRVIVPAPPPSGRPQSPRAGRRAARGTAAPGGRGPRGDGGSRRRRHGGGGRERHPGLSRPQARADGLASGRSPGLASCGTPSSERNSRARWAWPERGWW
jgi:hypothetical protein